MGNKKLVCGNKSTTKKGQNLASVEQIESTHGTKLYV
jgi:hypothetical protein